MSKTHGLSHTKTSRAWRHIKDRCYNPKSKDYQNYGARGIMVAPHWKDDFLAFYEDVSKLEHFEEEGYSLNRIDNDGNYEPGNVEWATQTEQNNNKRSNINITYEGKTQCLKKWSKELKIPYLTLYQRIFNLNWTVEKAFQTKVNNYMQMISYKGKVQSLYSWGKELKINPKTLFSRIYQYKWPIDKAFETPLMVNKYAYKTAIKTP